MNEEILKKLYDNASVVFDMPDYDQFVLDMQDESKLASFRQSMSDHYDIPEVDQLRSDIGIVKKKDDTVSASEDGLSEPQEIDPEVLSSSLKQNLIGPGIYSGFLSEALLRGITAGSATDESLKLMYGGKDVTDEDLGKFIKANNLIESLGVSKDMQEFNKGYEEDVTSGDSEVWAFIKNLAKNPKVAPEVTITSLAQMATGAISSAQGLGIVAAGAGAGAATGAALGTLSGPFAPVTSTIGAFTGTIKGAMSAAGGLTETTASFTEFLKEELGEKDFTQENIRAVLADEEAKQRIINRSLARGATIAAIDFLAAGASGKAASSIKTIGKTGKALRTAASTGVESFGGAAGEIAGRAVAGQEMDTREILFEAVGEAPGAAISGPLGLIGQPKYKVNGGSITKKDFLRIVDTATDEELMSMKISVDNDDAASEIINSKIQRAKVKQDIDPLITDQKDIDAVVDRELQIKDLKKKDSSSAKNRVRQLESEIKEIQDKYTATAEEAAPAVAPTVTQQAPQTVAEALNRPVTLTSLGGSVLDAPIEGDLYVEGQQVVVEDEAGNITELGNVDEISSSTLESIGIQVAEPAVKPMTDGNLMFEDRVLISDKKGIKRNKRGEISRVTLREEGGAFVTLRGANAEQAAYQILLREATSPEQAEFINQQLEQDEEFQNEFREATEPTAPEAAQVPQQVAGNRLRNEPLPDATRISDKFAERTGRDRPRTENLKRLEQGKSKKISDAFDALTETPADPRTIESYEALANETLEQYQSIIDEGYTVVIDNTEPYENSQDMISDLRDNKRMKIFSTESGFGDTAITDEQRASNPMLRDSGFTDANGQPLLVNDVFRFVHDFFGHAKVGNSFGPRGEEIAWQVHSQMYSPTARRAMTTETRGQNSWVNFSGVNDKAFAIRDEARALRAEADRTTDVNEKIRLLEEAKKKTKLAYDTMKFADQKIGLLPDEFVFEEAVSDPVDVEAEAESFIDSVGKKPLFQKEQTAEDSDIEAITKEMNSLSDERAEFDVPSNLTTKKKLNVKSLRDRFGDKVKVIKDMSFFEGTPFMFTISDQLTTGKWTSPFTGNVLDFFGGVGFNMANPGNAWVNVMKTTSNQTLATAKNIYENNKELFDRLWSEGKLPNGQVPMAVIKMGQESIESNEAIFRVVSDNITTNFNKAQRTEAKNILDQEIAKKSPSKKVADFLSKYTTIDQVLDNITELPLTSRSDVKALVMYGTPTMGAPTKPGVPNSPVLKYLLEGRDVSDRSLFHLPTINDSVREESTKDIPDGHIISVVGVDVLNPAVTSAANGDFTHQNYGFGVKGQLIGVIEKPSHAADIFPEMYSKSVRMFKEDKTGVLPSPKKAVDQAVASGGPVAIIKAFKGAKVSTKMSTMNVVLGKLRQAFPSVTVVNTKQEFDAMVNSPSIKKYSRDGEIIYGFTLDGRVFLNPDIATTNTAIHEYGHVWLNFIEEFNPALLKKGFDLLNGTDILAEKIKIHGDNRTARMEAIADLIGNRGESLVNAAQKSRFKNWLNAVFTYVKSKFKAFNDISADEFQNLTLNQFVDGILSDLLSGKEVTSKQVRSVEVQFQKADTNNLIETGISEGFSKEAIKLGLEKLGYDTSNFNKEFSAIRESFKDIEEKASEPKQVKVADIWDKSDKAIKRKLKSKGVDYYKTTTRELLLDRQTRIKRLLNGIGSKEAQRAANLLVTKAGGSGYANFRFKKADEKIFDGLSVKDRNTLDQIVYARRIDAINDNRKSRGLESYVGVEGFSQEDAKRELNEIKQNVSEEKFRDLSSRATEYFKVFDESLKRMRDTDLISEDVYNQLKDTEYSPIKTIKYLIPDDYDANETDRMAQITGMTKSVIQSLSDSNVNDIIMDSRWLLMTNVSMIEARVFENRMLNSFYDAIQSADADQKKAINEYVKDNPQEGTYKTGRPKYKYDTVKTPVGFVRVPFMRNGNKVEMIVSEAYAKQLLDVKTTPGLLEKTLPKITGTSILRFFATSGNPLFIVGNTAIDFANILFLSDVYSKNKFVGGAKLAADSIKTFLSKVGGTDAYNKAYKEYMEHGGSMDYLSTDGLKAIQSINPKGRFLEAGTSALRGYGRLMSYLGETSEISFRLAVYEKSKDNQLKEFKKLNKRDPNQQEMDDIMFAAAREARETIDFSQGGSLVKAGDKVLPYLNAATQGFRKAVDYAESNPLGFASSMVQGALMSGSIAALSMFLLLRSLGEDEDEEKVLDILNSVSDYEKANYHIIFTGNKDENGEYQYVRVKKLPTISLVATVAENLATKAILKSRGIDYDVDESILLKNVEGAAPIVPTPKNLLSRNPLVSAVVTYQFNYDMFYKQEIFRGPKGKEIDPAAEGAFDNRVDQMYKDLAPFFGLSPKRTKAAMEKIITSETTNPMIGLLYSGYDVAFKDGTQVGDEIKTAADRTLNSSAKKLVRKTNSDLIRYKQEDLVEKEKMEVDTERYLAEQKMYSEIRKKYKEDKGTFTNEEFVNLIKENFDPMDYKKYAKKYTAYIKNINSDPAILDIIFEDTPEIQAKMIFNKFGDSFEQEEIESIKKVYNAAGRKFSKKGLLIYNKEYKKK
jgi:hypothetical protein